MTVWEQINNEVDYVNRLKIYYWMEYGTEMEDGYVLIMKDIVLKKFK